MKNEAIPLDFFLGANTKNGFVSLFDEITGDTNYKKLFLIKGGAGCGKSTLMKKMAEKSDSLYERIHCSADPFSLDGVILSGKKISAVDATHPHAVEPTCPGAYETVVNLGECWDEEILKKNKEKIIALTKKIASYHSLTVSLLKAAATLLEDNYLLSRATLYPEKIKKTAKNVFDRETKHKNGKGKLEKKRFVSAVTSKGFITFTDTINTLCDRVYVIKDLYGGISFEFIGEIRKLALEKDFEIYTLLSPITLLPEHIIIPDLKIGFLTSSPLLPIEKTVTPYRVMHYTRFCEKEKLKRKKQRTKFNLKVSSELINEAVLSTKNGKLTHDELEDYYKLAIDYEKVKEKTNKILDTI